MKFQLVQHEHRELVHRWLAQDYVQEWFHGQGLQNTLDDLDACLAGGGQFVHWLAFEGDVPFGYLMTSDVKLFDEWRATDGPAITLDLLIGDPSYLGRGLAAVVIKQFLSECFPHVSEVLIDPDQRNTRAVRAYQKAGFEIIGEFVPDWDPVPHYMMRKIVS